MPGNAQLPQFLERTNARIAELQGEPFSDADESVLAVGAYDQLERDRTTAKQQLLERLGGLGHAATSGITIRALQELDKSFDTLRQNQTNQLAQYTISERQRRRSEAQNLAAALEGVGAQQQGLNIGWSAQDIQRALQLANLDRTGWMDLLNLGGQALSTAALPNELELQRLMANLAIYNGTPTVNSASSIAAQLANYYQNQTQNNQAWWASLLGGMANLPWGSLFGGGGGSGGGAP